MNYDNTPIIKYNEVRKREMVENPFTSRFPTAEEFFESYTKYRKRLASDLLYHFGKYGERDKAQKIFFDLVDSTLPRVVRPESFKSLKSVWPSQGVTETTRVQELEVTHHIAISCVCPWNYQETTHKLNDMYEPLILFDYIIEMWNDHYEECGLAQLMLGNEVGEWDVMTGERVDS